MATVRIDSVTPTDKSLTASDLIRPELAIYDFLGTFTAYFRKNIQGPDASVQTFNPKEDFKLRDYNYRDKLENLVRILLTETAYQYLFDIKKENLELLQIEDESQIIDKKAELAQAKKKAEELREVIYKILNQREQGTVSPELDRDNKTYYPWFLCCIAGLEANTLRASTTFKKPPKLITDSDELEALPDRVVPAQPAALVSSGAEKLVFTDTEVVRPVEKKSQAPQQPPSQQVAHRVRLYTPSARVPGLPSHDLTQPDAVPRTRQLPALRASVPPELKLVNQGAMAETAARKNKSDELKPVQSTQARALVALAASAATYDSKRKEDLGAQTPSVVASELDQSARSAVSTPVTAKTAPAKKEMTAKKRPDVDVTQVAPGTLSKGSFWSGMAALGTNINNLGGHFRTTLRGVTPALSKTKGVLENLADHVGISTSPKKT